MSAQPVPKITACIANTPASSSSSSSSASDLAKIIPIASPAYLSPSLKPFLPFPFPPLPSFLPFSLPSSASVPKPRFFSFSSSAPLPTPFLPFPFPPPLPPFLPFPLPSSTYDPNPPLISKPNVSLCHSCQHHPSDYPTTGSDFYPFSHSDRIVGTPCYIYEDHYYTKVMQMENSSKRDIVSYLGLRIIREIRKLTVPTIYLDSPRVFQLDSCPLTRLINCSEEELALHSKTCLMLVKQAEKILNIYIILQPLLIDNEYPSPKKKMQIAWDFSREEFVILSSSHSYVLDSDIRSRDLIPFHSNVLLPNTLMCPVPPSGKAVSAIRYCPLGDLNDYIFDHPNSLNISIKLRLCIDICTGISHLHKRRMVVGDIKPENIVLDCKSGILRASLIDCEYILSFYEKHKKLTVPCSPPEICQHYLRNEPWVVVPSQDIYSLGILFYYLFFEVKPSFFQIKDSVSCAKAIVCYLQINQFWEQLFQELTFKDKPTAVQSLIRKMLSYDPKDRPTLETVMSLLSQMQNIILGYHYAKTDLRP